jgi:hypothetical protein
LNSHPLYLSEPEQVMLASILASSIDVNGVYSTHGIMDINKAQKCYDEATAKAIEISHSNLQ